MGLLSWLNRRGGAIADTAVRDPAFGRADEALARGARASATIVGVEQKLDDGTINRFVAIAIPGKDVAGVQVMDASMTALARLRLGVEVVVRHDEGDDVVLDWPAMGIGGDPAQKQRRRAPAVGVVDKAVDWGEQRKLKKWTPRRATLTGLSRRDSAFGPTANFDVALRLDDGTPATAGNTVVPFYAAWLAAPGADVPVRVDPKDSARAVVDWVAAANEPRAAGRLDDPPPDGSAAALYAG